ncbi:low temperature requirement protein A [Streptomyces sp. NPDC053429]|uniref:low temperature requirement protein A n=1 Tax=Streptomyces sp. NPDC053429 TaxID=3365702 RepID=UPI0037D87802
MTYGNVAAETVHTRTVLIGMFGLAVLAAAVPGVRSEHTGAFALAYVLARLLVARVWQGRGEILADWPTARASVGVAPWVVSLWAEAPTRYWLWAAGLLMDLTLSLSRSGKAVRAPARHEEKAVPGRTDGPSRRPGPPTSTRATWTNGSACSP